MQQQCFFCGHAVKLIHVHGHYQCPVCGTNAMPCCDGDNCDTNIILRISSDTAINPGEMPSSLPEITEQAVEVQTK
ncbi:MAG: hypothetical protein K2Y12_06970 [Chitinophagaceae bacterium]|jgi:hypothetical protein|nr:hypothetical protein [Chitinophagales bacterium]MBX9892049.1 hypothetical protein [Chitinophagaceae bacterium]